MLSRLESERLPTKPSHSLQLEAEGHGQTRPLFDSFCGTLKEEMFGRSLSQNPKG